MVDATTVAGSYMVATVLGAGADSFTGGPARDTVFGGDRTQPQADTETDTITTGDGGDGVISGSSGSVNRDVVDTGAGDDSVNVPSPALGQGASLTGGVGSDVLRVTNDAPDLAIDMTTGTFTTPAGTATLASFEHAIITTGAGRLTYRGTPTNDRVTVHPTAGAPLLDISTAAGQDEIVVEPADIAAGSRLDGGIGRNGLIAAHQAGTMSLDLMRQELVIDGRQMTATGIQDAFLLSTEVEMVGDSRGNNLSFAGCEGTLRGRAGRDRMLNVYDSYFETYTFACSARTEMIGDGGADVLQGGQGADRLHGGGGPDVIDGHLAADTLLGGRGFDRVDGSRGRDRCVAEREKRCER